MILFTTDLDNTIIYSYKHNLGENKRNVEIYKGREISFLSNNSYDLLKKICTKCLIVPTTTRTIEQFERIDLHLGVFPYVLVCNGGILLENGVINKEWYVKSLEMISEAQSDIYAAIALLEENEQRYFEVRYIENLFVFTKCHNPLKVVFELKQHLNLKFINVFNNGDKVYVVPNRLSKGIAVDRLRNLLKPEKIIAAGDSEFDVSMVIAADLGIVPNGFKNDFKISKDSIKEASGQLLFSDEMLSICLSNI